MSTITAVAVIGKENEPLYVKTFGDAKENGLKFHYYVHTSLDVIDEKVNLTKKSFANSNGDLYLGLLFSVEDFKIYGYITNTKIKFVVVLKDVVGDTNIKSWFRELHALFVATMSNPFCSLNSKIESQKFEQTLLRMVVGYERKGPPT